MTRTGLSGKSIIGAAIITAVAAATSAAVQAEENEATLLSYAAGYKAGFTCSAIFNGGKSLDQIADHELTGVRALYDDHFDKLPDAVVDTEHKRVSVSYAEGFPPRIAQWRPHLGCAQLPPGATADDINMLPRIDDIAPPNAHQENGRPWTTRAPVDGSSGNAALDAVVAKAFEKPNYGRDQLTTAILIATTDTIIAERYIPGYTRTTSQRTWSSAKSIAATVLGAAVEKGMIDVNAPAGLAAWSRPFDPRGKITLQNLLQMASGLDSDIAGNTTPRLYFGGGLASDTSTRGALEAAPGKRWKYANNDTVLVMRALREAIIRDGGSRDDYLRFPFEALLYKIGMTHTKLEGDWDGNFIMSSQVWTTARDLARLGVLHLQDGVWNGERILPEGWAKYVATPAPAQPPTRPGAAIPGYGAQWWLYNERVPGVPDDAYAARGNRGQLLLVIPSRNLLIVRRGYDPSGGQGFQLDEFAIAVLAALDEAG